MTEQEILALASIVEALAGAVDTTGGVAARMKRTLERSLELTTDRGRASEAGRIVRAVINQMEISNVD